MINARESQTTGELFGELYKDTTNLFRLELELAKTEMSQKASRVGKNAGFLAAGGIVAYTGVLAIVAGLIALLGLLIPVWLSALIIGVVIAGVGGALVFKGIKTLQQEQLSPQKTMQTIKEDQAWIKDQSSR